MLMLKQSQADLAEWAVSSFYHEYPLKGCDQVWGMALCSAVTGPVGVESGVLPSMVATRAPTLSWVQMLSLLWNWEC